MLRTRAELGGENSALGGGAESAARPAISPDGERDLRPRQLPMAFGRGALAAPGCLRFPSRARTGTPRADHRSRDPHGRVDSDGASLPRDLSEAVPGVAGIGAWHYALFGMFHGSSGHVSRIPWHVANNQPARKPCGACRPLDVRVRVCRGSGASARMPGPWIRRRLDGSRRRGRPWRRFRARIPARRTPVAPGRSLLAVLRWLPLLQRVPLRIREGRARCSIPRGARGHPRRDPRLAASAVGAALPALILDSSRHRTASRQLTGERRGRPAVAAVRPRVSHQVEAAIALRGRLVAT